MNSLPGSLLYAKKRIWLPNTWYQDNVAAGQAAVAITLGGAVGTFSTTALVMTAAGSITGIGVRTNDDRTAGSATFEVYKNAAGTGLTAVLDGTNPKFKFTTQALGSDTFVAGDILDIRVTTTTDWTPVTADVVAFIEIES